MNRETLVRTFCHNLKLLEVCYLNNHLHDNLWDNHKPTKKSRYWHKKGGNREIKQKHIWIWKKKLSLKLGLNALLVLYVCRRSDFGPLTKKMQFWPPNFRNYAEKPPRVPNKGSKSQLFCKDKGAKEHISLNMTKLGG